MADIIDIANDLASMYLQDALSRREGLKWDVAPKVDGNILCCGLCGEPIPPKRVEALKAYGTVGTCVECAEDIGQ